MTTNVLRERFGRGVGYLLLWLILTFSWFLATVHLDGLSLWMDELFSLQWATGSVSQLIAASIQDFHPPLYFLMLKGWLAVAGESDYALRFLSIAASWLSLAVCYRLGRLWGNRWLAILMTGLCGFSPMLVLFGRMARYYSIATLLGLALTYVLFRLLREDGHWALWLLYGVLSLASLYTFYLTGLLIVAGGWAALILGRWRLLRRWLLVGLMIAAGMAPWVGVILRQVVQTGHGEAILSTGLLGLVLKFGYLVYDVGVGQTIFPWRPIGFLGAVITIAIFLLGVVRWWREKTGKSVLLITATSVVGGIVLIHLFSPRTPFMVVPARLLFVAPLIYAVVAWGVLNLRLRWAIMCLFLLGGCWTVSFLNYYRQEEFLDPIYLTPAREMATQVAGLWQPGDAILSPGNSSFDTYYSRIEGPGQHFTSWEAASVAFSESQPDRVWLVVEGRDQLSLPVSGTAERWGMANGRLLAQWGYVPQDPVYRSLKSRLLGQPTYEYRVLLQLYELDG
jgi:uncharacterized membrane protein